MVREGGDCVMRAKMYNVLMTSYTREVARMQFMTWFLLLAWDVCLVRNVQSGCGYVDSFLKER
jgi:hypothetical protein